MCIKGEQSDSCPVESRVPQGTVLGPTMFTVYINDLDLEVLKRMLSVWISVADPGCLSRIPDPDFYPSRIPDPKTATKERVEKKFDVIPFYVATNFTKLYIILVLKC